MLGDVDIVDSASDGLSGEERSTISSLTTCMGEWPALSLLLTDEAGEGGRHCEQLSSRTGVPARKLSSDSTAADVRLSRSPSCFCKEVYQLQAIIDDHVNNLLVLKLLPLFFVPFRDL